MTAMRLVLRGEPGQRLDLSAVTPDRLAGRAPADIATIPLHTTRTPALLGDMFDIHPGDPADLVIEGGSARLDNVGTAMRGGSLRVTGDVGQQAGRLMRDGTLTIEGSAGGWAGSGMRGGIVAIHGNAGPHLGGPLAGERTGMRGGILHVRGDAGPRAADRLRRGIVVVEGDAGAHPGSGMVAGTLVVCGEAGALPGILMHRGTLVLGRAADLAPTFLPSTRVDLVFTRLLARAVAPFSPAAAECVRRALTRYVGDMAVTGKGELFVVAG